MLPHLNTRAPWHCCHTDPQEWATMSVPCRAPRIQNRIQRAGIVNVMNAPNFSAVLTAAGRQTFIVAGVTNDVCTVFPVLTLLQQGHKVIVVADAGGSPAKVADELALSRMASAGATLVGTNQLLAGLAGDWSTAEGSQIVAVLGAA